MILFESVPEDEIKGLVERGRKEGVLALDDALSVLSERGVEMSIEVTHELKSYFERQGITLDESVDPTEAHDDLEVPPEMLGERARERAAVLLANVGDIADDGEGGAGGTRKGRTRPVTIPGVAAGSG